MGDSLEAALVSFGTGLIFVSLISFFRKDVRAGFADIFKAVKLKQLPMWRLSAGMLGASFVAMHTHVVPIAGVALFTVASLAGQTTISLWVYHVGLAGFTADCKVEVGAVKVEVVDTVGAGDTVGAVLVKAIIEKGLANLKW